MSPCSDSVAGVSPCCTAVSAREARATGLGATSSVCCGPGRSRWSGAPGTAAGWSSRTGRWASRGSIWPVHPTRATVAGEQAYPRVADLPGVPDAAFVAVPAAHVRASGGRARRARAAAGRWCTARASPRPARAVRRGSATCSPPPGRCRCSGRTATGWSTTPTRALIWPDQHGGVGLPAGRAGRRGGVPVVVDRDQRDHGRRRAPAALRRRRRQRRTARRGPGRRGAAGVRAGLRASG